MAEVAMSTLKAVDEKCMLFSRRATKMLLKDKSDPVTRVIFVSNREQYKLLPHDSTINDAG